MNPVLVVARREFLSTVRRRSYLIVTFGMPIFAGLYFGLFAMVPAWFAARSGSAPRVFGIVDEAGIVRLEEEARAEERGPAAALLDPETGRPRFRPFASRAEALAALRDGSIERVYVVPAGYLATGAVESYQAEDAALGLFRPRGLDALDRLLARSLLAGRVPEAMRARIERPIDPARGAAFVVRRDGRVEPFDAAARLSRLAIPGAFSILLLMSLMTSAGYLLTGVAEEKESRVIEVILASVRPRELLSGKLLGLGAAGLLQLAAWVAVTGFATGILAAAVLALLDPRLFLSCLAFFILGFLMIGSLMTGTGALGTNARESQQFAAIWSLSAVLPPAVTWMMLLEEPNGWLARGLGWFPLTAPITMMLRLGTGKVPAWDVAISIACLLAGVVLSLRLAAGLFRLGLLRYGRRPALREIVRQIGRA